MGIYNYSERQELGHSSDACKQEFAKSTGEYRLMTEVPACPW